MSFYEFTQIMERLGLGNCKAINDKDKGLFICIANDRVIKGRKSNNRLDIRERGQLEYKMYDATSEVSLCR